MCSEFTIRLLFGCLLLLGISCKNDAEQQEKIFALSTEQIAELATSCDYIDIIFYANSISMSQYETASIQNTIRYVQPEATTKSADCKAFGRIIFMAQGNILREADMYASGSCTLFEFVEDGETQFTNGMAPAGAEFFQSIMAQIKSQSGR